MLQYNIGGGELNKVDRVKEELKHREKGKFTSAEKIKMDKSIKDFIYKKKVNVIDLVKYFFELQEIKFHFSYVKSTLAKTVAAWMKSKTHCITFIGLLSHYCNRLSVKDKKINNKLIKRASAMYQLQQEAQIRLLSKEVTPEMAWAWLNLIINTAAKFNLDEYHPTTLVACQSILNDPKTQVSDYDTYNILHNKDEEDNDDKKEDKKKKDKPKDNGKFRPGTRGGYRGGRGRGRGGKRYGGYNNRYYNNNNNFRNNNNYNGYYNQNNDNNNAMNNNNQDNNKITSTPTSQPPSKKRKVLLPTAAHKNETQECEWWQKGRCTFGQNCKWLHYGIQDENGNIKPC